MQTEDRTEDQKQNLIEWNKINKKIGEDLLAGLIFENIIESSRYFSSYSTWLMAGTSAAVGLLLTNMDSIIPLISAFGFKICGFTLITSVLFGVLAKYFAIQCEISEAQIESKTNKISKTLSEHFKHKDEIEEIAESLGVNLCTEIDMGRVQDIVIRSFPAWTRWIAKRYFQKTSKDPVAGYRIPFFYFRFQCNTTALQTLLVFAGAFSAFYFA